MARPYGEEKLEILVHKLNYYLTASQRLGEKSHGQNMGCSGKMGGGKKEVLHQTSEIHICLEVQKEIRGRPFESLRKRREENKTKTERWAVSWSESSIDHQIRRRSYMRHFQINRNIQKNTRSDSKGGLIAQTSVGKVICQNTKCPVHSWTTFCF